MAASDEILGMSAHMDISDIQRSINEIIDGLDKIGIKTDVLSKSMNDAMNEIARSTDDSATKQKRAMEVLSQGMAEVKNAMANYPEQMRLAKNEADATAQATQRLENQLVTLKEKFEQTTIGSKNFEDLRIKIAGVEDQIINNNHAHEAQLATIQQMESGYSSLVQLYGVADTAVLANAAAHVTTTAATSAEAVAHTENAQKIDQETKAIEENKSIRDLQAEAAEKSMTVVREELSAYDGLAEKIEKGSISTQEYQRRTEELRNRIAALRQELVEVGAAYDIQAERASN